MRQQGLLQYLQQCAKQRLPESTREVQSDEQHIRVLEMLPPVKVRVEELSVTPLYLSLLFLFLSVYLSPSPSVYLSAGLSIPDISKCVQRLNGDCIRFLFIVIFRLIV